MCEETSMAMFKLQRDLLEGSARIENVPFEQRTSSSDGTTLYRNAFRRMRYSKGKEDYYNSLLLLKNDHLKSEDSAPMKDVLRQLHMEFSQDLQMQISYDILSGRIDARDLPFAIRTSEDYSEVYIYTFRMRRYDKDGTQYQEVLDLLKGDITRLPWHSQERSILKRIYENAENIPWKPH